MSSSATAFSPFRSTYIYERGGPNRFSPAPDAQPRFLQWAEWTTQKGVRMVQTGIDNRTDLREIFRRVFSFVAKERRRHARENGTAGADQFGRLRGVPHTTDLFYTRLSGIYTECGENLIKKIAAQFPHLTPGYTGTLSQDGPDSHSFISVEGTTVESYKQKYRAPDLDTLLRHLPQRLIDQAFQRHSQNGPLSHRDMKAAIMSDPDCLHYLDTQRSDVIYNLLNAFKLKVAVKRIKTPLTGVLLVSKHIGKGSLICPLASYIMSLESGTLSEPILFHSDPFNTATLYSILEELFCEILAWHQGLPLEALIEKVGFFRYVMGNAAIYGRGSATIAEILEQIFYRYHGFDFKTEPCDLWAISALTLRSFLEIYISKTKTSFHPKHKES